MSFNFFFTMFSVFSKPLKKLLAMAHHHRDIKVGKETIFVTGCDSGIGLCFAKYLASLGCTVFAGVLDCNSEGAKELKNFKGEGNITVLQIDVTDNGKVIQCAQDVEEKIAKNNLELTAVINNAGVMVFGEFEWQTEEQLMWQVNVNLVGYMRVAKAFCPLLRRFKGRLVNVSSHCAAVPLPCLTVYSATKSAIEAWSSALALELYKFNVPVVTLQPGSYARESGILKNHDQNKKAMWNKMTPELQQTSRNYFDPIMNYMSAVSKPEPIKDSALLSVLHSAVFSQSPKFTYVNSPWRYSFYYGLIALARPFWGLRRRLILSFINLPKYK